MNEALRNKWYVEPLPEEETEGWLLTYMDLITLLLVLLVVMLSLSGQGSQSAAPAAAHPPLAQGDTPAAPPAQALAGPVSVIPGLTAFPVGTIPSALPPDALPFPPAAPSQTGTWPEEMPLTAWEPSEYAPAPMASWMRDDLLFAELPEHFQAPTDTDGILRHLMGEAAAPAPDDAPPALAAAPTPEAEAMAMPALPDLGDGVEIIRKKESISFRINSEILYSSAKVDLSLDGLAVLRKLLPVLKEGDYIVTVEGHTDALPIRGGNYPSNWELSSARAGRVVRYLAANGLTPERLRAIGYADTRPLADNQTERGRAANRRVEIILEPSAASGTQSPTAAGAEPPTADDAALAVQTPDAS